MWGGNLGRIALKTLLFPSLLYCPSSSVKDRAHLGSGGCLHSGFRVGKGEAVS